MKFLFVTGKSLEHQPQALAVCCDVNVIYMFWLQTYIS